MILYLVHIYTKPQSGQPYNFRQQHLISKLQFTNSQFCISYYSIFCYIFFVLQRTLLVLEKSLSSFSGRNNDQADTEFLCKLSQLCCWTSYVCGSNPQVLVQKYSAFYIIIPIQKNAKYILLDKLNALVFYGIHVTLRSITILGSVL